MDCFGAYENEDRCASCAAVFFCIETTIQADRYYDEQADLQLLIEEVENGSCDSLRQPWL